MVGVTGFEPASSCILDRCSTRLSYTPTEKNHFQTVDLDRCIHQRKFILDGITIAINDNAILRFPDRET
jgi:hypothetical protein